jgi:hypothetical protein
MKDQYSLCVLILIALIALAPIPGKAQTNPVAPVLSPELKPESSQISYIPIVLHHPGGPQIFGVEMETDWNEGLLNLASEGGIDWVRRNGVLWNEIEAMEGVRDWSGMAALETEMIFLSQKQMKLILIVRGVPEWAQTENGHACGPIAQEKFAAFASFMNELVSRYSKPPYNVHYWEIGNEPDFPYTERDIPFGCWGDSLDPYYGGAYYGEMLKAIYPAIKTVDHQAQVLVGGLLLDCDPNNPPPGKDCASAKFLEGILRAGGGSAFDGVSFHSYDYYNGTLGNYGNPNWIGAATSPDPVLDLKANFLKSILQQYELSEKYLVNTENALLCNHYSCDETFELTKAIYVAQSYIDGLMCGVKTVIWYSYTGSWQSTRLVNGVSNPLPAFYALQAASRILDDMDFNQIIPSDHQLIYEFKGRGDRAWVLWTKDGQTHSITLPDLPAKMWDLFGNPTAPARTIEIGLQPIYLEWED